MFPSVSMCECHGQFLIINGYTLSACRAGNNVHCAIAVRIRCRESDVKYDGRMWKTCWTARNNSGPSPQWTWLCSFPVIAWCATLRTLLFQLTLLSPTTASLWLWECSWRNAHVWLSALIIASYAARLCVRFGWTHAKTSLCRSWMVL